MKSPSAPQPTQDQIDLEAMQATASAKLDSEENARRKRLLSVAEGVRGYTGSPLFRARPSNTAGGNTTSDAPARSNAPAFVPKPVMAGSNDPLGGFKNSFLGKQSQKGTDVIRKVLNPFGW